MIILITGASHTGKTVLSQRILEKTKYPYISIDHIKMGLIRSGNTELTPYDDEKLTGYLWPIIMEMIKTAIENHQNLIVEGCYIPFNWQDDFKDEYLKEIRFVCLVMSREYILNHFDEIKKHANDIEHRADDKGCTIEFLLKENAYYLKMCKEHKLPYILIDESYDFTVDIYE